MSIMHINLAGDLIVKWLTYLLDLCSTTSFDLGTTGQNSNKQIHEIHEHKSMKNMKKILYDYIELREKNNLS